MASIDKFSDRRKFLVGGEIMRVFWRAKISHICLSKLYFIPVGFLLPAKQRILPSVSGKPGANSQTAIHQYFKKVKTFIENDLENNLKIYCSILTGVKPFITLLVRC